MRRRDKQYGQRRVVITGLGAVTPLGTGVEKNWDALLNGRSGIAQLTRFDASDFPTRIAGEVSDFTPTDFIEKKEVKKMDLFIQYSVAAAQMAMEEAKIPITPANEDMVGCIIGVGIGGLTSIEENHLLFLDTRLKRVSPFFIPKLLSNLAPGQISIRYGAPPAPTLLGKHIVLSVSETRMLLSPAVQRRPLPRSDWADLSLCEQSRQTTKNRKEPVVPLTKTGTDS